MLDAGLLQERAERQPGLAGADDDQRQPCRQAARQAGREREAVREITRVGPCKA